MTEVTRETQGPTGDGAECGSDPRQASSNSAADGLRRGAGRLSYQDAAALLSPRSGVLQMSGGHADGDSAHIRSQAVRGLRGTPGQLPHLDAIQRSFGAHDVGGVKAHVGGPASAASRSMSAEAYASGDHVAFDGPPSLRTAAHEAAHTVQQRGGVQLSGGVGRVGDRYEQNADSVADRVVRGESAQDLLDRFASPGGGAARAVQRQASEVAEEGEGASQEQDFWEDGAQFLETLLESAQDEEGEKASEDGGAEAESAQGAEAAAEDVDALAQMGDLRTMEVKPNPGGAGAVQMNSGRYAPSTKAREKLGAAREAEAKRKLKALLKSMKGKKINKWKVRHVYTVWRKYQVSGDAVGCYNATVKALGLMRKRIKAISYIGSHKKQLKTAAAWWKKFEFDFKALVKQIVALGYSGQFWRDKAGVPVQATFIEAPNGKRYTNIPWPNLIGFLRFIVRKHNKNASRPEDFVWHVLYKGKVAMGSRLTAMLKLWSSNSLADDRYLTKGNVAAITAPGSGVKPGEVPQGMTSLAPKIYAAWVTACDRSGKRGPSVSRFVKEMEAVHKEARAGGHDWLPHKTFYKYKSHDNLIKELAGDKRTAMYWLKTW